LFRGAERARAFGLFGATVSVSSASGPILGGLILGAAGPENGWRYLFLVNVPIGLVAMAAIARLVPRRPPTANRADSRIDYVGAVLLGATVLGLLYPVVSVEGGHRWPLLMLLGVPLCGWLFLRWERRVRAANRPPLLDVRLLRGLPGYTNGLLVGSTYFAGYTGILRGHPGGRCGNRPAADYKHGTRRAHCGAASGRARAAPRRRRARPRGSRLVLNPGRARSGPSPARGVLGITVGRPAAARR
jgi:MFS family permease